MGLGLLQVEQRDEDRRSTRLAPPDDIRDELIEATILAVHPIGEGKKTRVHLFGGIKVEGVTGHIRGRADDVICDADVRRVHKRGGGSSRRSNKWKMLTNDAMILSIKLEEIQQFLWVTSGIDERGGVEARHGLGGVGSQREEGRKKVGVQLARSRDCGVAKLNCGVDRKHVRLSSR